MSAKCTKTHNWLWRQSIHFLLLYVYFHTNCMTVSRQELEFKRPLSISTFSGVCGVSDEWFVLFRWDINRTIDHYSLRFVRWVIGIVPVGYQLYYWPLQFVVCQRSDWYCSGWLSIVLLTITVCGVSDEWFVVFRLVINCTIDHYSLWFVT